MNAPATVDDYAYPESVALEAEAASGPSKPQVQTAPGRKKRGAEFTLAPTAFWAVARLATGRRLRR